MAPYCVESGVCESACTADTQCPGAAEDAKDVWCDAGACVECRDANDCTTATPVCDASACRGCATNGECATGVCTTDGSCALASDVGYVAPNGVTTGNCPQNMPCNLVHGTSTGLKYLLLASGTYTNAGSLSLTGTQWLIGVSTKPVITSSATGPIIQIVGTTEIHLENVQISGATGSTDGSGISCTNGGGVLTLRDVVVTQNQVDGLVSMSCSVDAATSQFINNGGIGLESQSNSLTADRCMFSNNQYGMTFDGGTLKASNSFFTRNLKDGVQISTQINTVDFEFNTVVDNGEYGIVANSFHSLPNNVVARNTNLETNCNGCQLPGSIVMHGADVSTLHFLSPDAQPYDYHLGAGSIAIDAAVAATLDHDYDGDARPKGAARDLGADEAQ